MKANELMIGDWVLLDFPYPPTCKSPRRICLDDMIRIWQGADCKPIPLTTEILEKNFPKAEKVAWWHADDYDDADDRIHISGSAIGINGFMWYVHELQHALRLCGLNDLADNFKV